MNVAKVTQDIRRNLVGHGRNDTWLGNYQLLTLDKHSIETVKSMQRYKLNRK